MEPLTMPSAGSARVVAALQRAFPSLRPTGANRWASRSEGAALELRLGEQWLDIAMAAGAAPTPFAGLTTNAALPDSLKLAATAGGSELTISMPLDNPGVLDERLRQAARALTGATRNEGASAFTDGATLRALATAAGWPTIDARDGWRVEIDCRGAALLATCSAVAAGVVARLDLAACAASAPAVCRDAASALLWRVNGAVRLVRGSIHDAGGALQPQLSAALTGACGQSDIAHLIAALAVAARHCALEIEALAADPQLARLYLARGNRRRVEHHHSGA